MTTVWLSIRWFFHCWKSIFKGETLHKTPYGEANWAQFKQGMLMKQGKAMREDKCKVCERQIWTSVESPICNQLKCYVRWHGKQKASEKAKASW